MANTFITNKTQAGKIASTALSLLMPDLVLARTVNRDFEKDFGGGVGNVVNVKRPTSLAARTRTYGNATAITVDNITEAAVQPVTIDTMIYSAVGVTDEDLTLELEDFAAQVLAPQISGIAYQIESKIATQIQTAQAAGLTWGSDYAGALVDARKVLRLHSVPTRNLVAAVAPDVAAGFLKSSTIRDASQAGTLGGSNDALREAYIGRIAGMDVVESNMLPAGYGYVYHRDAFTLALRAPVVPDGAPFGASETDDHGFALRWIRDYDASVLQDRSILSVFAGTAAMALTEKTTAGAMASYVPAIKIGGTGS